MNKKLLETIEYINAETIKMEARIRDYQYADRLTNAERIEKDTLRHSADTLKQAMAILWEATICTRCRKAISQMDKQARLDDEPLCGVCHARRRLADRVCAETRDN